MTHSHKRIGENALAAGMLALVMLALGLNCYGDRAIRAALDEHQVEKRAEWERTRLGSHCSTDSECAALYGGDGGPEPRDPEATP